MAGIIFAKLLQLDEKAGQELTIGTDGQAKPMPASASQLAESVNRLTGVIERGLSASNSRNSDKAEAVIDLGKSVHAGLVSVSAAMSKVAEAIRCVEFVSRTSGGPPQ